MTHISDICLTGIECNIFYQYYLHKYQLEVIRKEDKLLSDKFYLVNKILFSHLGFKKTVIGLHKGKPYKLDDWENLTEGVEKLDREIKAIAREKKVFYELYVRISDSNNISPLSNSQDVFEKENEAWKRLQKEYETFGVNREIKELQSLIWKP